MHFPYSQLITASSCCASETHASYQYITERHLQAIWFEQKYFKNPKLECGTPVEVISPGIWNSDAGPDFLKAHIKIGDKEYRGDVEIHLNACSWEQHQHHSDPRYDNVILHVSLWNAAHSHPIRTSNNRDVYSIHLESVLTISLMRIVQLIDLDLYPYKRFLGSGRCAHEVFRKLPEERIKQFFRSAAKWRLIQKRNYLKGHMEDSSWQFLLGAAIALGYKKNAEAFLDLFKWLHSLGEKDENKLLAYAMKATGFFDGNYQKKWNGSEHYRQLEKLSSGSFPFPRIFLGLHQIRPFNHPIRRMVTMIKLLTDNSAVHLFDELMAIWDGGWPACQDKKGRKLLLEQLCAVLPEYKDSYWNHHYTFETEPQVETLPLMGQELKGLILVNTILPLIHEKATRKGNPEEIEAFSCFFNSLSAIKSSKTRYLIHRFFGDTPKGELLNKADIEQGAYQLHRDFCLHYEASCEGCPFVERFKEVEVW